MIINRSLQLQSCTTNILFDLWSTATDRK